MADEQINTATLDAHANAHAIVNPSRRASAPALDIEHQRDVLARLKRIEGQLRGIRKMIIAIVRHKRLVWLTRR